MNNGWFSVHRALDDHWLWKKEKFTKGQAWIDLLMHANHKENKTIIKGRLVVIQRGEQIRSQVTLATKWKWNPRTVKKFLDLLVLDSMITLKTTELTTHISICNYDTFQSDARKSTEQTTQHSAEQCAEGVQSTVQTNNNVNNDNNVNKELHTSKPKASTCPFDNIVNLYHNTLPNNPRVAKLSVSRKAQIKARWNNGMGDEDSWKRYFELVKDSKFLTGQAPPSRDRTKPFSADIDFLIKEANVLKIVEGKYHE